MLVVLATAWLLAAPAAAAAPTPDAPQLTPTVTGGIAAAPPKIEADPMVCRSESVIGSKLPKKICIRKSERDRQRRESEEALQLIQRRSDGPVAIKEW